MLKSLSIRKAFAAFGASSALVCCVALNLAIGNANLPLQIALSALLLAGGAVTGILIGRFYGRRAEVIVGGLNALAKGHLDCRLDLDGRDDFAWLCYEYNAARKAVKKLVEHLQALSGTLTSAAVELSEHSGSARENGARQLDSIRAVGSAIEQMSGNIRDIESLSRGRGTITTFGQRAIGRRRGEKPAVVGAIGACQYTGDRFGQGKPSERLQAAGEYGDGAAIGVRTDGGTSRCRQPRENLRKAHGFAGATGKKRQHKKE